VDELTLWQEDPPAKTCQWLEDVRDWMVNGADCSGINAVSLIRAMPVGFCGKTSLALSPATTEPTSLPCCGESPEHSPTCPMKDGSPAEWWSDRNGQQSGGCLTLDGSEFPNDAVVSLLSQVLEPSVDPKYCLSPQAAQGILRRAEKRGRLLPLSLQQALEHVAQTTTKDKPAI